MVNRNRIINIIGLLVFIEGLFVLLCIVPAIVYNGGDKLAILISASIMMITGSLMWYPTRKGDRTTGKREGFIIVSMTWIVFSLFGSLPFWLSGYIPSFTDAFFETISGFTTTGATILTNIEDLPHGLHLWRSLTQWLGGMGIIVLSLAILPVLGIGGMQLFVAEVPGPTKEKLHPRVTETAKRLWVIYIAFTGIQTILLLFGGMDLFDAVCHSFTTMATGGYSTKDAGIASFNSPFIEYVIIIFMVIAGTNFVLSYFVIHMRFNKVWENEEFRFYIFLLLVFSVIISAGLYFSTGHNVEEAFRISSFQVVSIMTTTGFATADYIMWPPILTVLIFLLMFIGGSAGSTGGGMKVMRILLIFKNSYLEVKRLIHPHAILSVRLNQRPVSHLIISNVLAFGFIYVLILMAGGAFLAILGYDMETSFGASAACLGNIGPGIGLVGPMGNYGHFPDLAKWFLGFLMLLGRLELFTVLVLLAPSFWRK